MKEFVVFYAWQSDRQTRFNKFLIRAALDFAAKRISDDPAASVRVKVDADTEGVLGHVPVTETILKKVAACDAFVPDLTFVATTSDGKLIPNPNVMLEYGYALRARSYSVMIPVMNTAYGPPEKLPFDMAHSRHPLQFDLPLTAKDAERRAARQSLAQEFERILRLMVVLSNVADEREAVEKVRQEAARRVLAPELKRTIDRVLYIHSRAIPNFVSASVDSATKPNDRREDFLPYQPSLYPNAQEGRNLTADDAAALSAFYDSLHTLADFIKDWWEREGQLPVNIFNMIVHNAEKSLELALVCIDKFGLDLLYPPPIEAYGTLASRIKRSIQMAADAQKHHIARHQAKAHNMTPIPPRPQERLSRRSST